MKLAITGGTGFVGAHLLDAALAAGHQVTALTRRDAAAARRPRMGPRRPSRPRRARTAGRPMPTRSSTPPASSPRATPPGSSTAMSPARLSMLAAATAGGARRFVHVSSLAAREPKLSLYGASKARAEALVDSSGLDWVIVRPPAVYGPGDKETLELFRMAKLGLMLMPPKGRLSLIHVDDLARLLLALAAYSAPVEHLRRGRRRQARRLDPPRVRPRARHRGRHQAGDRLLARHRPPPRRPRRPIDPRPARQADRRPRRLFLAPQLGDRAQARLPAGPVAAADRDRAGPRRHRRLVSRAEVALASARLLMLNLF